MHFKQIFYYYQHHSLKVNTCHDTNFVVNCGTRGCHNHRLHSHQITVALCTEVVNRMPWEVWYKTKVGSQNFGYQLWFCTRVMSWIFFKIRGHNGNLRCHQWRQSFSVSQRVGVTWPQFFKSPVWAKIVFMRKCMLWPYNRIHIRQLSPQLSCGDTWQIWMWYFKVTTVFISLENAKNNRTEEIGSVTSHPGLNLMIYTTWWCITGGWGGHWATPAVTLLIKLNTPTATASLYHFTPGRYV